ncbi:tetratricopeptide repeat protein 12-like isoform X1 [Diorhabda carinulata]|uniref:tetratricopeptide repeat protein 12-like isoform X1 n=1 Tax=Diorhabda carinulata TaxID=1163345 RepID=UPI0025A2E3F3|nr:tetratricopeptide repeat protein 12-like isoform X1 [Diorhabda carinulata]
MSKFYDAEYLCKDEEFNNFMIKVNEVNRIVKKLASNDKAISEMGDLEAKRYLNEDKETEIQEVEDVVLKIKCNRTVVNKKGLENEQKDQSTMSKEAFMREVEKDADKRYKDKLVRTEKMETFKKRANNAFRRGEFEKALTLYTKAIEQIKDSVMLYNNRSLTYINLKLYDKAEKDLDLALRLNEDCLKSWLLLAKVHFLQQNKEKYDKDIEEAIERNPKQEYFIKDYIMSLEKNKDSECSL